MKIPNFPLSSYCENRLAPTRTTTPYLRIAPIVCVLYLNYLNCFLLMVFKSWFVLLPFHEYRDFLFSGDDS